ncbi:transposable element Tcb2 transposase [Trichonephila clavipes]|uniref:Transposable element Tcb2 transposase n=1 Tax=Trichonephila clavipes TaxID=2585209 RepID=A0A8X6SME2_TRICX|nr:transposable element Tcb2 transposase [Trichonephila clavipes]
MNPTCQQRTVQTGGSSVMVWGVCSWRDMGPQIYLDRTLTGNRYVGIMSDLLHPFISIVHSDGEFQQDNATPPTSRISTKWIQEHSSEFKHLRRPPKSPDMNIIEPISDVLPRAFQKRSPPHPPHFPTDLWTALQDSWCQLPPALLQTLMESMPRHVAALLSACGGPTQY